MRRYMFSVLLVSVTIPLYSSPVIDKGQRIANADTVVSEKSVEYEAFARKYAALFGKKPCQKIWGLSKSCKMACSSHSCRGGCSTKCTGR